MLAWVCLSLSGRGQRGLRPSASTAIVPRSAAKLMMATGGSVNTAGDTIFGGTGSRQTTADASEKHRTRVHQYHTTGPWRLSGLWV